MFKIRTKRIADILDDTGVAIYGDRYYLWIVSATMYKPGNYMMQKYCRRTSVLKCEYLVYDIAMLCRAMSHISSDLRLWRRGSYDDL